VAYEPETSPPWDEGAQRNVYLARPPGRLVFYELDELDIGDEMLLQCASGMVEDGRVREPAY
jgi:hypothetical protein